MTSLRHRTVLLRLERLSLERRVVEAGNVGRRLQIDPRDGERVADLRQSHRSWPRCNCTFSPRGRLQGRKQELSPKSLNNLRRFLHSAFSAAEEAVAAVLSLGLLRPRTVRAVLLGILVEGVVLLCFDTFSLSRATERLNQLRASGVAPPDTES
jgi:hypothetical protein